MKLLPILLLLVLPANGQEIREISHYLFPTCRQGVILLKDGKQYKNMLNYNSLTEEMVFEERGQRLAVADEIVSRIDTVFIDGRKFCRLSNRFLELVYRSTVELYAEHKCWMEFPGKPSGYGGTSQTSSSTSYSSFISDGRVYNLTLPDGYKAKPYTNYWLKRNGELLPFSNLRQLRDLYPDQKDLIKAYLKSHEVSYTDQASLIGLIGALEK